jgi:protein-L-isoaspartate(D-aspartate) O-methyltransferase
MAMANAWFITAATTARPLAARLRAACAALWLLAGPAPALEADGFARARDEMVSRQIAARGIDDPRVLEAMRSVERHLFVPAGRRAEAYHDDPLPIGHGQTISQPYIVALMTELAQVRPGARVLEVGTGSGYQAAVLAALGGQVHSIEIVEPLARAASERLARLGYRNVTVRVGDGYGGWPEKAPFDAIVVTAAPPRIPPALVAQLAPGGRLVAPVGDGSQELVVIERTEAGTRERRVAAVRFVPMTGEAQRDRPAR